MNAINCGSILLCIVHAVNGQIAYDNSYHNLTYGEESRSTQARNEVDQLKQLFNNITGNALSVSISNGTEQNHADRFTFGWLDRVREQFVYDFNEMDYVSEISKPSSFYQMDLGFQLPFFGARYRRFNVSLDGAIYFSEQPNDMQLPIQFPLPDWPPRKDPALIGILLTKTSIGEQLPGDTDTRKPGLYCRHEHDLDRRPELGKLRERIKWDIRQGMVGTNTFEPKHAVVVTWKNVTQTGEVRDPSESYRTNSYQIILATDEKRTYAIFNYIYINWDGQDNTRAPAFVGFNAGNGRESFEYAPFSQAGNRITDLTAEGGTNNFPGRHIFRIDEQIVMGTCHMHNALSYMPLVLAPQSGNMLGGTVINVTGPCFHQDDPVFCRFDKTFVVQAHIIDRNRAVCLQPLILTEGYISFDVSIGGTDYIDQGWYFVETPSTADKIIRFPTNQFFKKINMNISEIIPIEWNPFDLSADIIANITISLWGYSEAKGPKLVPIAIIDQGFFNGHYELITTRSFPDSLKEFELDFQFGFLHINLTNPLEGFVSPSIWSKPMPLARYFGSLWERRYGPKWAMYMCNQSHQIKNTLNDLKPCPCTFNQADKDKGRLFPDPECSLDSDNEPCPQNPGAIHCMRTSWTRPYEHQCCYNSDNLLMSSMDEVGGSRPSRSRLFGQNPYTEANNVPSLSTWYEDIAPFYMCCIFQDERSEGCRTYRTTQRVSSECKSYETPRVGAVFGDPHIMTFDQQNYTFNGVGEFVLVRSDSIDVQGRFEEIPQQPLATRLTSIVAKGNGSVTVEVRQRALETQWRYRLDVLVDNRKVYFDSLARKVQYFDDAMVYTPVDDVDQSHVIIMLGNGIGIEVQESAGIMAARVYLPPQSVSGALDISAIFTSLALQPITTGLLGNWNEDVTDDFRLPTGNVLNIDSDNLREVHENFGTCWKITKDFNENLGRSLFLGDAYHKTSLQNNTIYSWNAVNDMLKNVSQFALDLCDNVVECYFDYAMTLSPVLARSTRIFHQSTNFIVKTFKERLVSCGHLKAPNNGQKSNFQMMHGSNVEFTCNEGYLLKGDAVYVCGDDGKWTEGHTECEVISSYSYVESDHTMSMGQKVLMVFGVLLMTIGCIMCISWRRRALQRQSRLQGNQYEQVLVSDDLDDELVEWEVGSKAAKQF